MSKVREHHGIRTRTTQRSHNATEKTIQKIALEADNSQAQGNMQMGKGGE